MRRLLPLVAVAALAVVAPAAAFTPADPLAAKQWYLQQDHAFDAWAEPPTTLAPVKVAIVDSGLDCSLPDFQGRLAAERSFVGGDPCVDTEGHGTFIAGIIAANLDTQGIVGIAYTSQLLIAKVVQADGTIPLEAEAAGIRWAADSGAKVINLSLGGVRDPVDPNRDTFSSREASAVAYAYSKGAVIVAAVGNGDEAPTQPWPYASYPAALPHVIGVSALTQSGAVPDYSNRDAVFNDISAPGSGLFSTFPATLTAQKPLCTDQGYSDCGSDDYRDPEGTSFAAPQVSAAAAVLFALVPTLTNSQVSTMLEHSADDVSAATGCSKCLPLRDAFSGWGRLDIAKAVAAALAEPLPAPDHFETNDDSSRACSARRGLSRSMPGGGVCQSPRDDGSPDAHTIFSSSNANRRVSLLDSAEAARSGDVRGDAAHRRRALPETAPHRSAFAKWLGCRNALNPRLIAASIKGFAAEGQAAHHKTASVAIEDLIALCRTA